MLHEYAAVPNYRLNKIKIRRNLRIIPNGNNKFEKLLSYIIHEALRCHLQSFVITDHHERGRVVKFICKNYYLLVVDQP